METILKSAYIEYCHFDDFVLRGETIDGIDIVAVLPAGDINAKDHEAVADLFGFCLDGGWMEGDRADTFVINFQLYDSIKLKIDKNN